MQFPVNPAGVGQVSILEQGNILRLCVIQHLQSRHFGRAGKPVLQDSLGKLRKLHALHRLRVSLQQGNQVCLCTLTVYIDRLQVHTDRTIFIFNRLFILHIYQIDRFMFRRVPIHYHLAERFCFPDIAVHPYSVRERAIRGGGILYRADKPAVIFCYKSGKQVITDSHVFAAAVDRNQTICKIITIVVFQVIPDSRFFIQVNHFHGRVIVAGFPVCKAGRIYFIPVFTLADGKLILPVHRFFPDGVFHLHSAGDNPLRVAAPSGDIIDLVTPRCSGSDQAVSKGKAVCDTLVPII